MKKNILDSPDLLGKEAAEHCARSLRETLRMKGKARIVLSTGASQFAFFEHFVRQNIDWTLIEMFHLDEYVHLPESHPASFRKYLKERFLQHVNMGKAHMVDGEGDVAAHITQLTEEIRKAPIDLAVIGIGENAHIAFNDPPANFDTKDAYIVVKLDDACKRQQVGEGWFAGMDEVPKEAITMTVYQIMQSEEIISVVPHLVKADAIKQTLEREVTPLVPATVLKTHPKWTLYLDRMSASKLDSQ